MISPVPGSCGSGLPAIWIRYTPVPDKDREKGPALYLHMIEVIQHLGSRRTDSLNYLNSIGNGVKQIPLMVNMDIQKLQHTCDAFLLCIWCKQKVGQSHIHVQAMDRAFRIAVHNKASLSKSIGMEDNKRRPYKGNRFHGRTFTLAIPLAMRIITKSVERPIYCQGTDEKRNILAEGSYPLQVLSFGKPELHSIEIEPLCKGGPVIEILVCSKHLNIS